MMSASLEYYRNVLADAEPNKPGRLKVSTLAFGGERVSETICTTASRATQTTWKAESFQG